MLINLYIFFIIFMVLIAILAKLKRSVTKASTTSGMRQSIIIWCKIFIVLFLFQVPINVSSSNSNQNRDRSSPIMEDLPPSYAENTRSVPDVVVVQDLPPSYTEAVKNQHQLPQSSSIFPSWQVAEYVIENWIKINCDRLKLKTFFYTESYDFSDGYSTVKNYLHLKWVVRSDDTLFMCFLVVSCMLKYDSTKKTQEFNRWYAFRVAGV